MLSEGLTFQLHKNLRSETAHQRWDYLLYAPSGSIVYYSVTGDVVASSSQRLEQSQIKHYLVVSSSLVHFFTGCTADGQMMSYLKATIISGYKF